jgi:hypothetical protein
MKIKLFENFGESPELSENFGESPEFTQSIGDRGSIDLSTYKEPYSLRSGRVKTGSVSWKLNLDYRKWGIDMDSFQVTKLDLEIELEDEEKEEEYTKEISVPLEALQDPDRFKVEIEGFPLTITYIEIDMRHSEDPEDWKYEIKLGKEPE